MLKVQAAPKSKTPVEFLPLTSERDRWSTHKTENFTLVLWSFTSTSHFSLFKNEKVYTELVQINYFT